MISIIALGAIGATAALLLKNKKKVETFMPPLDYRVESTAPYLTPGMHVLDGANVSNIQMQQMPRQQMPQQQMPSQPEMFTNLQSLQSGRPIAPQNGRNSNLSVEYTTPQNRTSVLSPRMGNVDYGAYINYRKPDESVLAVEPFNPLGVGADGDIQPIIYDRFVYANKRSRLQGLGDPIRGDIPILPITGSWFVPAVTPEIDLREGALAVMGGRHNDTATDLAEMKYRITHGAHNISGGMHYSPDAVMQPLKQTGGVAPLYQEIINRVGDVTVQTMN